MVELAMVVQAGDEAALVQERPRIRLEFEGLKLNVVVGHHGLKAYYSRSSNHGPYAKSGAGPHRLIRRSGRLRIGPLTRNYECPRASARTNRLR